jgi:hypothetical protein
VSWLLDLARRCMLRKLDGSSVTARGWCHS